MEAPLALAVCALTVGCVLAAAVFALPGLLGPWSKK